MQKIANYGGVIKQNFKNRDYTTISENQVNCINYLNKQKYTINSNMLNILLFDYFSNEPLNFGPYNKLHKLSLSDDPKILKNIELMKEISAHNAYYYLYKYVLSFAIIYENIEFYLPTFMDFRGRIYSYSYYLSFQGCDIARSLLLFSEGCELNNIGKDACLHFLCNTAGHTRLTIKNRIKWSEKLLDKLDLKSYKNIYNLINLLKNNNIVNIIKETEEPAQFMSILIGLIEYFNNPNYLWKLPICFDATCSGMQHLSALLSEVELGKFSNVIADENIDVIYDVYKEIADHILDYISKLEDKELSNVLNKIDFNRKLLKKPVMTVPYNVSLESMKDQLIAAGFLQKKYLIYEIIWKV